MPGRCASAHNMCVFPRSRFFRLDASRQSLRLQLVNKSRAAKRLGLTRTQLYGRLRKYGLDATNS